MKLIPQWRKWWKRQSFWIGSLMPAITWAREQLPSIQEHMPAPVYSVVMVGLFALMILAMQIHQESVSGSVK